MTNNTFCKLGRGTVKFIPKKIITIMTGLHIYPDGRIEETSYEFEGSLDFTKEGND